MPMEVTIAEYLHSLFADAIKTSPAIREKVQFQGLVHGCTSSRESGWELWRSDGRIWDAPSSSP